MLRSSEGSRRGYHVKVVPGDSRYLRSPWVCTPCKRAGVFCDIDHAQGRCVECIMNSRRCPMSPTASGTVLDIHLYQPMWEGIQLWYNGLKVLLTSSPTAQVPPPPWAHDKTLQPQTPATDDLSAPLHIGFDEVKCRQEISERFVAWAARDSIGTHPPSISAAVVKRKDPPTTTPLEKRGATSDSHENQTTTKRQRLDEPNSTQGSSIVSIPSSTADDGVGSTRSNVFSGFQLSKPIILPRPLSFRSQTLKGAAQCATTSASSITLVQDAKPLTVNSTVPSTGIASLDHVATLHINSTSTIYQLVETNRQMEAAIIEANRNVLESRQAEKTLGEENSQLKSRTITLTEEVQKLKKEVRNARKRVKDLEANVTAKDAMLERATKKLARVKSAWQSDEEDGNEMSISRSVQ